MRFDELPGSQQADSTKNSPEMAKSSDKRVTDTLEIIESDEHFFLSVPNDLQNCVGEYAGDLRKTEILPGGSHFTQSNDEPQEDFEGQIPGRFVLEKEIARGGMGIVFQARDVELDRKVAVKFLLKQHQNKLHLCQQFTKEARITGRLQHPGIVPIYETGVSPEGRPFFVMKLVQGKSLAELLAARSSSSEDLPRLLNVFQTVCQTLSYVHACGVIHLDIKPANIMVGAFGEVHLMDWGLALAKDDFGRSAGFHSFEIGENQGNTQAETPVFVPPGISVRSTNIDVPVNAVRGTPAYMSPEQARGFHAGISSDLFGLGGILCEILTGRPPYSGVSFWDVCFKATKADLSETYSTLIDSGADGVLVRLAMKCLSPEPESRPANAGVVASELTIYLESLLQRAKSDLERFFELSLDLFCIAGLDGYFRRVNSNFTRVLGHSERTLLSRPFMHFVHPDDQEQTVSVMSQLQAGRPVVEFQNRYGASDGSWRNFEWTAKSIPNDNIIFAVARDVTNRVR
jgi:PAS domain S-box-containing protein